jgi:hypothetical protein
MPVLLMSSAAWAQPDQPDAGIARGDTLSLEDHTHALSRDLDVSFEARFLQSLEYGGTGAGTPLDWQLEQSYEFGGPPCTAITTRHGIVSPAGGDAEPLIDIHSTRRFDLGKLRRIAVKPGAELYTISASFVSSDVDVHTVTVLTEGSDIAIEYYGFDSGVTVPSESPLSASTYYHHLFAITRPTALQAAADLQALAEECGAEDVRVDDLI